MTKTEIADRLNEIAGASVAGISHEGEVITVPHPKRFHVPRYSEHYATAGRARRLSVQFSGKLDGVLARLVTDDMPHTLTWQHFASLEEALEQLPAEHTEYLKPHPMFDAFDSEVCQVKQRAMRDAGLVPPWALIG
jgi:hypothetical protein